MLYRSKNRGHYEKNCLMEISCRLGKHNLTLENCNVKRPGGMVLTEMQSLQDELLQELHNGASAVQRGEVGFSAV